MTAAFDSTARVIVDQTPEALLDNSGETWSLNVSAADPSQPVRIVLAYTDQPGAIGNHRNWQVALLHVPEQRD